RARGLSFRLGFDDRGGASDSPGRPFRSRSPHPPDARISADLGAGGDDGRYSFPRHRPEDRHRRDEARIDAIRHDVPDAHAVGVLSPAGRRRPHALPPRRSPHPLAHYPYSGCPRGAGVTTSLALFLAFIVAGVPIAFALGAAALAGLWLIEGAPLRIVASRIFGGIDNFSLLAIPFFILAGELMEAGGISQRLVDLSRRVVGVGHLRGGLGTVVLMGMIFFPGISGSTNADAAAIGWVMTPPMKRQGYSGAHAGAIVAAAAGMGILVPPCLTMIVYGSITNTSIATLFAAGFLPAFI